METYILWKVPVLLRNGPLQHGGIMGDETPQKHPMETHLELQETAFDKN